jgi:hypothetical protein
MAPGSRQQLCVLRIRRENAALLAERRSDGRQVDRAAAEAGAVNARRQPVEQTSIAFLNVR